MENFRSNGKILLTGEYAVLDGAKSLALPTKFGQRMEALEGGESLLSWKSYDKDGKTWFRGKFKIIDEKVQTLLQPEDEKDPGQKAIASRLEKILTSAYKAKPQSLKGKSYSIKTYLEFNREWGLGSSSTLINNLAQWLKIDPYQLLEESFGGSGYDIAAAGSNHPITYQKTEKGPVSLTADFDPPFKEELFFVYLNRKQNSREAIAHYRNQPKSNIEELIDKISGVTEQIIQTSSLAEFELLLQAHEALISNTINLPRVQNDLFEDYPRFIKSLGGWGGDFILATGGKNEKDYFRKKGYKTIFDYSEFIL